MNLVGRSSRIRPEWQGLVVALLLGVALPGLASCSAGESRQTPRSVEAIDMSALAEPGFGEIGFVGVDGNRLRALTYRGTGFDPDGGPVWFVMHGASRDVERYIRIAAPVAERYDALAVAIHFPRDLYPRSEDYTLGVVEPDRWGRTSWDDRVWREPAGYAYTNVEGLYDRVRTVLGGEQVGYFIFGHSAGAQFTHRLLTFLPSTRVLGAVVANAGWYTMPLVDDPDVHSMPYGLIGSPVGPADLGRLFATRLVVLLGEDDTSTAADDRLVRGTPEAQAQGQNRLARGQHYFEAAQEVAVAQGMDFAWELHVVPRAGHDAGAMIDAAGYFTFTGQPSPCSASPASSAASLEITEILADPPAGPAGDANGDGRRDPQEDEFIEFVNTGNEPICLEGWTLGDAERPDRHVFPPGPPLGPGEVLVVFGGGVPTGDFHGARVQWSDRGLGLSNAGDVLTLRDPSDAILIQISWGDADGARRAMSHWDGDLGFAASLVRAPGTGGSWQVHPELDGRRFSPGSPTDPRPAGAP
jgi:hypothetical protein